MSYIYSKEFIVQGRPKYKVVFHNIQTMHKKAFQRTFFRVRII